MTSTIKVNTIQNACGADIIKESGNTITIGASGDTVTLGTGASQTGFGRTGTVNWCTTAKTSPLTVESGKGYFLNTTSGGITVTLPSSPSAGDIVAFKDYANKWDCNAVTICRNGSNINGGAFNTCLSTESQSVTLIYVDGTKGWQDIHDSTSNVTGQPNFVSATGGTETTSGDFKIHTFTGDGSFVVTQGKVASNNKVSYVVVAGGGGGGSNHGGGGGAGGFREGKVSTDPYTASPLAATPCSSLPVSTQSYPIVVGGGGNGATVPSPYTGATNGSPSTFSSITSTGGGRGGTRHDGSNPGYQNGQPGGSGGGGGGETATPSGSGGSGNTPSVSPPQGNNGASMASPYCGGGGGGATSAGTNIGGGSAGGAGGNGAGTAINTAVGTPGPSGSLKYFAGGGGAGRNPSSANGGYGGGGSGYPYATTCNQAFKGTTNTGGGGGVIYGCGLAACATATGGSGIVIIRYKFQ